MFQVTLDGDFLMNVSDMGGHLEVIVDTLGSYQINIEASGYINSILTMDFTEFLGMERLVAMSPILNIGNS